MDPHRRKRNGRPPRVAASSNGRAPRELQPAPLAARSAPGAAGNAQQSSGSRGSINLFAELNATPFPPQALRGPQATVVQTPILPESIGESDDSLWGRYKDALHRKYPGSSERAFKVRYDGTSFSFWALPLQEFPGTREQQIFLETRPNDPHVRALIARSWDRTGATEYRSAESQLVVDAFASPDQKWTTPIGPYRLEPKPRAAPPLRAMPPRQSTGSAARSAAQRRTERRTSGSGGQGALASRQPPTGPALTQGRKPLGGYSGPFGPAQLSQAGPSYSRSSGLQPVRQESRSRSSSQPLEWWKQPLNPENRYGSQALTWADIERAFEDYVDRLKETYPGGSIEECRIVRRPDSFWAISTNDQPLNDATATAPNIWSRKGFPIQRRLANSDIRSITDAAWDSLSAYNRDTNTCEVTARVFIDGKRRWGAPVSTYQVAIKPRAAPASYSQYA